MTSPEALELEAIDAALAGRPVAPEHAELADLALLLRDERPEPDAVWARQLDRKAAAGFPSRARKPRFPWLHHQAAPVVAVLLLLAIPIGLAATLSGGGGGGDDSGSGGSTVSNGAAGSASSADEAAPNSAAAPAIAERRRERSVERSAELTLAAPRRDIDRVAAQIGDVTADLGGFVARSSVSSSQGGTLRLRIPSDKLDEAIQRLSKLGKVRDLSRSSEDITARVVSARARLNDARAERKGLLRQLANATTINETDSIKARLRIVSREIAAARTALRVVDNRADFADVSVSLVPAHGSAAAGGTWTPGDAFHDALRVLEVVAGVLVVAGAVLAPLLVAWLLGWLARRGVVRRRRDRALDTA